MRKTRKQSGMTLVELSLAGVLTSVALIGTTASLFSSVSLHETISRKRGATRSVSSLLEDVRATDFDDLETHYKDSDHVVRDGGGKTGTARVTVSDVDSTTSEWRVHEVRIDVTYPGGDLDDGLTFVTFVSDRTEGGDGASAPLRGADVPAEGGNLLDLIAAAEDALNGQKNHGEGNGNGNGNTTTEETTATSETLSLASAATFESELSGDALVASTVEATVDSGSTTLTEDQLLALYMEMLGIYFE